MVTKIFSKLHPRFLTGLSREWRPPCWAGPWRGRCPSSRPTLTPTALNPPMQPEPRYHKTAQHRPDSDCKGVGSSLCIGYHQEFYSTMLDTSRIASNWGRHCSRFLRPMWRNDRRSFSFTWGCRSFKEERGLKTDFCCLILPGSSF